MNFNIKDIFKSLPNSQSIEIVGNCTITNYKKASALIKNPFTIIQKDGKIFADGLAQQEYKEISKSLNVFSKIASMDGNSSNLTAEDLKLARQDFKTNKSIWENLGVKTFGYDPNDNVANIDIDGQTLRIDFDNKEINQPKIKQNTDAQTSVKQKENSALQKTETSNTAKASSPKKTNTPDKYAGIPKKWIPEIKNAAKKWGFSENIIITKILAEGYTPVAEHKNEGGKKGLNEVGFGHTTNAKHNNKFKAGYKTNIKEALDWLCQDIKDKEADIKKFGEHYNYNGIPQPLKEMMIDVAFNRGENRLNPESKAFDKNYKSVIANIKNGYWGSAAVRLRQEKFSDKIKKQGKEGGLRKRNVQRFLQLMSYLKPEKIVGAMDLFNREYYYTKTLNMLKQPEADSLKKQWNDIYNKAKAKCTKH